MDSLANPDVDEDEADVAEIEQELNKCMRMLKELMDLDWRPFLINGMLLCHNPNDCQDPYQVLVISSEVRISE